MTSAIREYINEWIKNHGSTITIYNRSSTSYSNYYDDPTPIFNSGISTYGVVVPIITNVVNSGEGQLTRADTTNIIIGYDETISNGDKIAINSVNYNVTNYKDYEFQGSTIGYLVELSRDESSVETEEWNILTSESFSGSDCSVSNGELNRVLTTVAVGDRNGVARVIVDTQTLAQTKFSITGNKITFTGVRIWDSQTIEVYYLK